MHTGTTRGGAGGDLERLMPALDLIDPDLRDHWLTVGMALHSESGGSDVGFDVWTQWSAGSAKYNSPDQQRTWRSFKLKPGGITGGSIIDLAKANGYRNGHGATPPRPSTIAEWKAPEKKPMTWDAGVRQLLSAGSRIVSVYSYVDASGVEIGQNVRFEPKTFRWRHRDGDIWMLGLLSGPIPPYGLARLLEHADELVFDAEGEKDADRINAAGGVCISSYSGHEGHAAQFLKGRTVFILPDNDDAGRKRAQAKLAAYRAAGITARIIDLPGLADKGDVYDWLDEGHTLGDLIRLTEEAAQTEASELLAGVTWSDDVQLNRVGRHLVKKVLPTSGIGLLYAPSYVGKTFVAHDIALAVARGIPFAGRHETASGIAIYIALEDPTGLNDRHVAHRQVYGVIGARFAFVDYPLQFHNEASVGGLVEKLEAITRHAGTSVSLVIIDTLAKAMVGLDENSAGDMAVAMRGLETIQKATGGCVMAVHHTGKDPKAGMRGSSAAFAAADFVLRIDSSVQGGMPELWVEKLKIGIPHQVGSYRIVPHVAGKDDDGQEIETAIIRWIHGECAKRDVKLTPPQKAIMNHLTQLMLDDSKKPERFIGRDGMPDNKDVWRLDDLIDRAIKGGDATTSDRLRNQREAIRGQIIKLQSKGLLQMFDGKVWLIKEV